jgi:hypothetical protein
VTRRISCCRVLIELLEPYLCRDGRVLHDGEISVDAARFQQGDRFQSLQFSTKSWRKLPTMTLVPHSQERKLTASWRHRLSPLIGLLEISFVDARLKLIIFSILPTFMHDNDIPLHADMTAAPGSRTENFQREKTKSELKKKEWSAKCVHQQTTLYGAILKDKEDDTRQNEAPLFYSSHQTEENETSNRKTT